MRDKPIEYIIQSTEEAQELCQWWQERLGLRDWLVAAKVKRARDMMRPHVQGCCDWTLEHKQALIHLMDHTDYDPSSIVPQDMERTLVHELLHIHHAPIHQPDGLENIALEQAIEAIAGALVTLKRSTGNSEGFTAAPPGAALS